MKGESKCENVRLFETRYLVKHSIKWVLGTTADED